MIDIQLIPQSEFTRVRQSATDTNARLPLLADMCRANALAAVKWAGSGHLGSSFSAMDIVIWLYYQEMNTIAVGHDNPNRDIYFSSKGHDVPGLYAVLYSLGVLSEEKLLMLRRFGGLDGHPDIGVTGIEANSGSLGMGMSKGRGMAWAKRMRGYGGQVFVMLGDGELQEGQNYEALQSTVHQGIGNLTVIVDHNKVQSDKQVQEIVSLGDLDRKFADFGWCVRRCNGHDFGQLAAVFAEFRQITDRPKVLIADTIKGRGVSFMEHPQALNDAGGYYRWHAGAPDDISFRAGHSEIIAHVNERLQSLGLTELTMKTISPEPVQAAPVARNALGEPVSRGDDTSQDADAKSLKASAEYVVEAYGKALIEIAPQRPTWSCSTPIWLPTAGCASSS